MAPPDLDSERACVCKRVCVLCECASGEYGSFFVCVKSVHHTYKEVLMTRKTISIVYVNICASPAIVSSRHNVSIFCAFQEFHMC